jgi:hypothetical protein
LEQWLLPLAGRLVPRAKRRDWVREWQAEFWHLRHSDRSMRGLGNGAMALLSLAWGLTADAAWMGFNSYKQEMTGSAQACLYQLAASCLICGAVELLYEGSWRSLLGAFGAYFVGRFMLVTLPAIFVALATMPRRPRKCNRGPAQRSAALPEHARWNLFLTAKVGLSVTLGFLVCVLVSIPVRRTLGHNGDWVDVLMSTVVLTSSLRLALDDQTQRCQRCLRLLRQPVRVGPPSYNLLNWSGTEMVCADGHGLLQSPEMQGSWCWYDLWVEVDPAWRGALHPES